MENSYQGSWVINVSKPRPDKGISPGKGATGANASRESRNPNRGQHARAGRGKGSSASARKSKQPSTGVIVALVIVLCIGALVVFNMTRSDLPPALASVVERHADEGANHVATGQRVTYRTDPPNSGPHYAQWAPPGFYDRTLPDELLVHNLEHGHIIIHYRPDALTPEVEQEMLALTRSWTDNWAAVLAVPRPGMQHKFTLAAWRHLLRLEEWDRQLVDLFIDAFVGRGPENPVR